MRAAAIALMLLACDPADMAPQADADHQALIYGSDDRREAYSLGGGPRRLADATAAVIRASWITENPDTTWTIDTQTSYGDAYRLCPSEPYVDQPASADCTAFLVADDLVATAGHCAHPDWCGDLRVAFGFEMLDPTTVRDVLDADDVYRCAEVVDRANTWTDDWAVVRLDRPVVGRRPLQIRRSGAPALGTPLAAAGHPSGLPMKVAAGARVRRSRHAYFFEANLDTYGGNSGSPVVDTRTGIVQGILARGLDDFVRQGSCWVSHTCPDTGCPGFAEVSRTTRFDHLVP